MYETWSPTHCFTQMQDAFHADRLDEANKHADTLDNWLSTGGQSPHVIGDPHKDRRCVLHHIKEIRSYTSSLTA